MAPAIVLCGSVPASSPTALREAGLAKSTRARRLAASSWCAYRVQADACERNLFTGMKRSSVSAAPLPRL